MRHEVLGAGCVVLLLLVLPASTVDADDWTSWRGPAANGVTAENGWKAAAVADRASIVWKTEIGMGHSSVAVLGDQLFTMGYAEAGQGSYEEIVYCLDANTGRERWRYAYPSRHVRFPGPGATPVVDGDAVYTISRGGDVLCFDAASGSVRWKRQLVDEGLAQSPSWGFCSSPAVEGKLLILNAARSGLALNKRTGQVVWASEPQAGWLATPMLFSQGGKRLAAISARGQVYVVDVADGSVQWSYEWNSDADPTILGSKMLLMGGGRGKGSVLLEMASGKPEVLWENGSLASTFQTAVVVDGHAFGFGRDRRNSPLQCVDMSTGEVKWSHNAGEWGSLIAADGKLVIIDGDGDLVVAEASAEGYTEIASAKVLEMKHFRSYDEDAPRCCWTNPVLANGRIYARDTHGGLVCVDVRS